MRLRELRPDLLTGEAGKYNAITDVKGVRVGHAQVWKDNPHVQRTGATVVFPHPDNIFSEGVFAHTEVLNGFGILTGRDAVDELGFIASPIVLTNTRSIGMGYEAVMQYFLDKAGADCDLPLPVVGECDDSYLNDSSAPPVPVDTFRKAMQSAASGTVEEGGVGAGTGMQLYDFKGGIGTSSRVLEIEGVEYTVGVLLNANYGSKHQLSIFGMMPFASNAKAGPKDGSCIGILATDLPVSSGMLGRLCKRIGMGLARTGSVANNSSGDIFIAFSTADRIYIDPHSIDSGRVQRAEVTSFSPNPMSNVAINMLFEATVQATEEAALNALFQAKTTEGYAGHVLEGFSTTEYAKTILLQLP